MNWGKLVGDIRFWICIGFALRLLTIDTPIFDSHNWRQADGYAVARNFLEESPNIFERRIDNRGSGTGITPSEFPLMNYITYLCYLFTGVEWWPARLLNLAVTSLGIFSFHQILKVRWNERIALYSSLILLFSIWFSFGRKFMPDTFSASILLTGIWLQVSYLKKQTPVTLVLSIGLISIGLLTKITSFPLLLFSVFLLLDKTEPARVKKHILIGIVTALIPAVLWYFYWNPKVADLYANGQILIRTDFSEHIAALYLHIGKVLKRFYQNAFYYIGFLFFLVGAYASIKEKKSVLKIILIALTFAIYVLFSGFKFAEHDYYIIPLVPFMALGAAYGLSYLRSRKLSVFVLCLIVIESFSNQISDIYSAKPTTEFLAVEEFVDEHLPPDVLVATNSRMNTNILYFSHRKGWALANTDFGHSDYMKNISVDGCEHILWYKKNGTLEDIQPTFKIIAENEHFFLLQLSRFYKILSSTSDKASL